MDPSFGRAHAPTNFRVWFGFHEAPAPWVCLKPPLSRTPTLAAFCSVSITWQAGMTRRARPDLDAMSIEEGGEIISKPTWTPCARETRTLWSLFEASFGPGSEMQPIHGHVDFTVGAVILPWPTMCATMTWLWLEALRRPPPEALGRRLFCALGSRWQTS
eukprot:s5760_g5.t1